MDASVKKALLVIVLAATAVGVVLALYSHSWRALVTGGLLLNVAGFLQLEIAGLFSRQIVAGSDPAAEASLQDKLFACRHTGFYLILAGLALQLASIWAW